MRALLIFGFTALLLGSALPASAGPGARSGKIVFESARDGDSDIYIMEADGSNQRQLTDSPGNDAHPRWSPDGSRILFHSDRAGRFALYVMDADGSGRDRLTYGAFGDMWADWSPDGSRIVFVRFERYLEGGSEEIYTIGSDGSNPMRLTHNDWTDTEPSWSGDGTRIAFTSYRPAWHDPEAGSRIMTMRANGHDKKVLTGSRSFDGAAAWDPSGRCIAFVSDRDGDAEVYVMDAQGRHELNVTRSPGHDSAPAWSPDGRTILLARSRPEGRSMEIYRLDLAADRATQLTTSGTDYSPDWQPNDDRRRVFGRPWDAFHCGSRPTEDDPTT